MQLPAPIISDELDGNASSILHGFFTRTGGVSSGIYRGLNVGLGSKDDREAVQKNRTRVANFFLVVPDRLLTAYQVHSDRALAVAGPFEGDRPQVDALVTDKPGIAIGILTADCGPVLFCDAENRIIGAAHAGWQGATGGVLENTVREMEKLGAKRDAIKAVLGPTISQTNYEVGPEFAERLDELSPENEKYLNPSVRDDHHMFDLPAYIVDKLTAIGVTASWTGHCTYGSEDEFFSYRRTTHKNEPDYGRQISVISIAN